MGGDRPAPVPAAADPGAAPGDRRDTAAVLRLDPAPPLRPREDVTTVVLDTTWTALPGEPAGSAAIGLREIAERVLATRDVIEEAADLLDTWAEDSGIADALVVDGTSFWYAMRLRYWMWVVDRIVWLAILDELLGQVRAGAIECAAGTDGGLREAARAVAARDGLAFRDETPATDARVAAAGRDGTPATQAASGPPSGPRRSLPIRLVGRLRHRFLPDERERRRRTIVGRLRRLERQRHRPLLVVQAHARQRIDTPDGTRFINPYLGPVAERLAGTRLDPVEIDIRADLADDVAWARLGRRDARRLLPADALRLAGPKPPLPPARARAAGVADRIAARRTPLVLAGVDLGPTLAAGVADRARTVLVRSFTDVARIRQLLRRLRPAGILLADEYHRQDWLAAAAAEGVRTAAIQHGVIYRWHTGYVHRSRPASLRLPDRTYVFGDWERTLLTTHSVYRPDEVRVGGSPRLDLVAPGPVDVAAVRAELGVAPGDRLVVLSGTWGEIYRRFHYPIALARLFCRPIERVHLVVKLHPSERDEGPYRRTIERLAAAGGFDPPHVSVVQSIDLYRLLAAADAHLGIHSTVLTEAVATGTPNLLADVLAASDLLGYVEAGAAVPVRTPEDVAAALTRPRAEPPDDARREAFLRAHFEPGDATGRIAGELLEWLP